MPRKRRARSTLVGVVAVLAVGVGLAACGSSKSTTTTSSSPPASTATATTSAPTSPAGYSVLSPARAETLAAKVAKAWGSPVAVPKNITVGLIDIYAAAPAAVRLLQGAVAGAKVFGWKTLTADAMSNPLNEESDLVTFVNEHVNAIIAEDLTTEAVKAGLKDAAQHGIPVISIGSAVSSDPAYWGAFNNPFPSMGTLLGQAAGASIPKGGDVALQIDPAGGTGQAQLDNGAEATLKAAGAKIVATHDINGTNLVSDITSATNSQAESDPNLKAIVMDFDSAGPIAATVLKSRGLCGKVKLWTIFADPANLTQIGTGCLTGISNFPLEVNSWAAIDQLAEHFARHAGRGQLLSGWPAMSARYGVVLTTPNVVTKANLPPVGQEPTPAADFAGFFQWKWHDEFGTPAP